MSGLSCAYHLKSDFHLLERSDEPGGLSRSIKHEGFVYDHTGHLLHLRNPYTLQLIPDLLGDNLASHERRAWIYSHGAYTRYPFQANTYGLPHPVIKACLNGLIQAQLDKKSAPPGIESFGSWVLRTFGEGFAKYFFFPYNEKLWTVPPHVLTAEWAAPFVPNPSIPEILEGAFSDQTKKFGYNATFYYPKVGGIQSLAFAFSEGLPNIHLNTGVKRINLSTREVMTENGASYRYEHLVTTLPLVRFLQMADGLPPEIQTALPKLTWSSVYNINLGIERPDVSDKHWIYFPEKKYRFYRVGFPMNFAPSMTPRGCSSMYIEIGHQPNERLDDAKELKNCLKGLKDCGLITAKDKIRAIKVLHIPVAYVTYDQNRTVLTQKILKYLESEKIYSIGRFGGWKYSYMEEAILEGKATAETIDGR